MTSPPAGLRAATIKINGASHQSEAGERLVDAINRTGLHIPQVCYHPMLGPIQTCDTCIVEVDGKLARACGTLVSGGPRGSHIEGKNHAEPLDLLASSVLPLIVVARPTVGSLVRAR